MIPVTDDITIDEWELELRFVRAGGPGGQHVNKASTAVQLRFDIDASPSLPEDVRSRLRKLAGTRVTEDGILTIEASRFRSQARNREDAIDRLVELIRRAAEKPKKRRRTKLSAQAKKRRLDEKRRRSELKDQRRPVREDD